jgi:hypothetical protein
LPIKYGAISLPAPSYKSFTSRRPCSIKRNGTSWQQAAKWSRENADVLVDTHWVGGDPTALEVYGWASWSKDKAILGIRNPSDKPQILPDLTKAFELPHGATRFTLKLYGSNPTFPEQYQDAVVTLAAITNAGI